MNHLSKEQQALLLLLQRSIWGKSPELPEQIDWEQMNIQAKQQGVVAFAYDGAVALNVRLPDEIRQRWSKTVIAGTVRNERLLIAQDQVLAWLGQAQIPAVILKGSSVSRYYPQPDLRALGDIDILIPRDRLDRTKEILQQNGYTLHESDHEFHLGFGKSGVLVEIHYDVTSLPNCRGEEMARKETARFLETGEHAVITRHEFPVLTEKNQALALLLHMVRHMTGGGIGLRQLCDWMMYVAHADLESFAQTTAPMLDGCGLLRYAQVATRACVRYLGLDERYAAWCEDVTDENARAFIQDIFRGGNMGSADSEKMGRTLSHSGAPGKQKSYVKMMLDSLTRLACHNFPIAKKCKLLLPVFWIYLPIRYWVRSLLGLREKKSIIKAVKNAKAQQDYYHMLGIYRIDE